MTASVRLFSGPEFPSRTDGPASLVPRIGATRSPSRACAEHVGARKFAHAQCRGDLRISLPRKSRQVMIRSLGLRQVSRRPEPVATAPRHPSIPRDVPRVSIRGRCPGAARLLSAPPAGAFIVFPAPEGRNGFAAHPPDRAFARPGTTPPPLWIPPENWLVRIMRSARASLCTSSGRTHVSDLDKSAAICPKVVLHRFAHLHDLSRAAASRPDGGPELLQPSIGALVILATPQQNVWNDHPSPRPRSME